MKNLKLFDCCSQQSPILPCLAILDLAGDLSTSDFSGQVRAPEFVHVKNSFSNDFVSTGGASSLTAIHRVAADGKTGRAGSAPAQR